MVEKSQEYHVIYRKVSDGDSVYHVFTSIELPGLYIASKDAAKALADIPKVTEFLIRENQKGNPDAP